MKAAAMCLWTGSTPFYPLSLNHRQKNGPSTLQMENRAISTFAKNCCNSSSLFLIYWWLWLILIEASASEDERIDFSLIHGIIPWSPTNLRKVHIPTTSTAFDCHAFGHMTASFSVETNTSYVEFIQMFVDLFVFAHITYHISEWHFIQHLIIDTMRCTCRICDVQRTCDVYIKYTFERTHANDNQKLRMLKQN